MLALFRFALKADPRNPLKVLALAVVQQLVTRNFEAAAALFERAAALVAAAPPPAAHDDAGALAAAELAVYAARLRERFSATYLADLQVSQPASQPASRRAGGGLSSPLAAFFSAQL